MTTDIRKSMANSEDILEIENLKVVFPSPDDMDIAVEDVNLRLQKGRILGLAGESGSGKSVTSLSILGLNDSAKTSGSVLFRKKDGKVIDILSSPEKELQNMRGSEIAMIFQEPGSALNPVLKIGSQLEKTIKLHDRTLDRDGRKQKALSLLKTAGLEDAERIYRMYPHELSGGMKQRVVIAMAISSNPTLILADEPTTALDETIQDEILELLAGLARRNGVSLLLISHDLAVISRMADSIAIMRKGIIVEEGLKDEILDSPGHPYTRHLLDVSRNMEEMIHGGRIMYDDESIPTSHEYEMITETHRVLRRTR